MVLVSHCGARYLNAAIFILALLQDSDATNIIIPPDTVEIDEKKRIDIMKKINLCEMKGKFLDTLVVDQLMCNFHNAKCFVFPTYSPSDGNMSPYYERYIGKNEITDRVELIVLPLCDGTHFYGYVIDMKKGKIIFVDSMYQVKWGKRSIGAKLAATYFGSDDVEHTSYYPVRVQSDNHTCGAWLIAGFVGYILGIDEVKGGTLTREKLFNLMVLLIEDLDISARKTKALSIYRDDIVAVKRSKKVAVPKVVSDDDDDKQFELFVKAVNEKTRQRYDFDDSSEDDIRSEKNDDILFNSTSTPLKRETKENCTELSPDSSRNNSDINNSSIASYTKNEIWNNKSNSSTIEYIPDIPEISLLSSTDTFENNYAQKHDTVREQSQENASFEDFLPAKCTKKPDYVSNNFLETSEVLYILSNQHESIPYIPPGIKENTRYIICNKENVHRRSVGQKNIFFDDCGVWDWKKGKTNKSHYSCDDPNAFKHIFYKNGLYVRERRVGNKKVQEEIKPQPLNVVVLHRYYTVLKRSPSYKRKVSWLEGDESTTAFVEYIGKYPETISAHGNMKKHEGEDFRRTNPDTIKKIESQSKYLTPREVYKTLSKEDSFNGPKDFKQCQNIAHNKRKKEKTYTGKKKNFADELLECMELVDSNPFVQNVFKSKGSLPNFILYTDEQIEDLSYFVSHQGNLVLGVDRTFNLGNFYVTALVYKNQRVVRSDNPNEHPLFLGPIYLHRDATFEAYHAFFSSIKATLCRKHKIHGIEVSLGKNLIFGSDEEQALTKAIESVFASSVRTLCTKHLKDNVLAYMQNEAGVPQKDRQQIATTIFGDDGVSKADDSSLFDKRCMSVILMSKQYPKFLAYYTKNIKPALKNYVVHPANEYKLIRNWTNNNCESLNHIMKLDAKWKPVSTPELIESLHEVVSLHFRDFRRALYGSGNYRLVQGKKKRYGLSKESWRQLNDTQRGDRFRIFLKNQNKKSDAKFVKSSYSKFTVPNLKTAKKPGQRKRVRAAKTSKRH